MPRPTKGARMGGSPAHQRHMLANLATALFEHGRITTTEARAKRLRPYAEKLITFAKRGDLHARRQVLTVVTDKSVVHSLFAEIGPRFATRPGGYTRITKLGPRQGDNAPMALIELVEEQTFAERAVGEAERARRGTYTERTAVSGSTREAAEELAGESPTAAAVAARAAAEPAPDGAAPEQVAVPTEGGDTEVVTEAPAAETAPAAESAPAVETAPEPVVETAPEPAGAETPDVPEPTSEGAQGSADDSLPREAEVDATAGEPGDDTAAE